MVWYEIVGWLVFFAALIIGIVLFSTYKKFYHIMFLISISLYVFALTYSIEIFKLSNNIIMFLLIFSALLMIGMGYYLSKNKYSSEDE